MFLQIIDWFLKNWDIVLIVNFIGIIYGTIIIYETREGVEFDEEED